MPEGHTIHRVARDHGKLLAGTAVRVSSPQGRFAADAERVDGATLERLEPYGKHLFYHWSTGEIGHVHLGLFGRFRVTKSDEPPPVRGAVRMRLVSASVTIDLSGPTACTVDAPDVRAAILDRLGPDPLRRNSRPERMFDKVRRSSRGIGDLVMDQSVVAGVGNVFRAEALFVTGIHPLTPGRTLTDEQLTLLWDTIGAMLRDGVRRNRILTVDRTDLDLPPGRRIPRREATYVYKRDRCLRCASEIESIEIANRTAYFCPTCQAR